MADAISHPEQAPQNRRPSAQRSTSSTITKQGSNTQQEEPAEKRVTPRPTYISNSSVSDTELPQAVLAKKENIDIDEYFVGPRNLDRHSKIPIFLRVHGSVMPRMIIPLAFMAGWSTLITCISKYVHNLGISSILLTVLGFVVGLSLSLRSSTAYERYAEGRKYWATLMQSSRILARIIWIHNEEGEGEEGKQDILGKLTGINLLVAFAIALKHKLRFEPDCGYEDLSDLIRHLDTFAKEAHDSNGNSLPKPGLVKAVGQYLSVPMAMSNPRKAIKRSNKPIGNLPVEILSYLSAYVDEIISENKVKLPVYQSQAGACLASLEEVMTGTERVLNTPLPLAYTILISQISWVYVLALPFQLYRELEWITIPGSIVATYIIHGIASICAEIENPFGNDVNDLPLDAFCEQLAVDLDIITSAPPPKPSSFINRPDNFILYPLSKGPATVWKDRTTEDIRDALKAKATISPAAMHANNGSRERVLSMKRQAGDMA